MGKRYSLVIAGVCIAFLLQGQTFTLATNTVISKGIRYQKYTKAAPEPQQIHVLEIDLGDPTIKLQSVKASDVQNGAVRTVKQQAAAKDVNEEHHNVIGAINGDFFSLATGNPENLLVSDGQLFADKFGSQKKTIFGIDANNNPFISYPSESYKITRGGVDSLLDRVNGSRSTNQLVLYNQYRGGTTGTNNQGTELRLGLVAGQSWKANGPVQCTVLAKEQNAGNMSFSAGQAVLSGNGNKATYLNTFTIGQTVTITLNVAAGVSNIMQVTGGFPRLVTNGVNVAEDSVVSEGGDFTQDTTHHPHTGVGISQDERTMYMVVVDGRHSSLGRHGMTLTEFGDLFKFLGAYNAVNFDGGYSSTLVANNVIMNIPSDGPERAVGSSLLVYTKEMLLDDFEAGEGHFNQAPTFTLGTQYTVGISATSTMDRVTTNACSREASERAILVDDAGSTSNWTVRLLSGSGLPANNEPLPSSGTLGFWMKTNTAQTGATVQLWFDDTDGAEASQTLTIINDGQWHQYNFDLNNLNGTTVTSGNGQLDAATITLDAIVLKQNNTSSSWTVYFDDLNHDPDGVGTNIKSQNQVLDDFEANSGHFNNNPTHSAGGTQYTVGIASTSTLQRVTTEKHRGIGGLRATLIDSAAIPTNWTVRLLSGSGMPANNVKLTSDGVLSFWMKTSTAQNGATVQVWFDDTDGAEASSALTVNNDGQWHRYTFDLSNFNGTTITTGNGQLDGATVTLDAIVLKQNNTASTWTVYFDDVRHIAQGISPGTVVNRTVPVTQFISPVQTEEVVGDITNPVLFPNPANASVTIDFKKFRRPVKGYRIEVLNASGVRVFETKAAGTVYRLNTKRLSRGLYFVRVSNEGGSKTLKLMISR
jgi:exopolysaccharide biosynthesis protein